jgi:hypothetical protein
MDPREMTRDDLIATVGAQGAKLKSQQERIATLEGRVKELLAKSTPVAGTGREDR